MTAIRGWLDPVETFGAVHWHPIRHFLFYKVFSFEHSWYDFRSIKVKYAKKILPHQKMSSQLWPPLGAKLQVGVWWGFNPKKYIYQGMFFSNFSLERIIWGLSLFFPFCNWTKILHIKGEEFHQLILISIRREIQRGLGS